MSLDSARELRADAIEARLAKLSGKRPIDAVDDASGEEDAKPEIDELLESEDGEDDGEIEYIDVDEIDREARQAMDDEDDDGSGDAKGEMVSWRIIRVRCSYPGDRRVAQAAERSGGRARLTRARC